VEPLGDTRLGYISYVYGDFLRQRPATTCSAHHRHHRQRLYPPSASVINNRLPSLPTSARDRKLSPAATPRCAVTAAGYRVRVAPPAARGQPMREHSQSADGVVVGRISRRRSRHLASRVVELTAACRDAGTVIVSGRATAGHDSRTKTAGTTRVRVTSKSPATSGVWTCVWPWPCDCSTH